MYESIERPSPRTTDFLPKLVSQAWNEPAAQSEHSAFALTRQGIRFCPKGLQQGDDLVTAQVPIVRCINGEIGLALPLYANIAVVQAARNSKVAVLLITDAVDDLELADLKGLLEQQGWTLPVDGFQAWQVTSQIAVSISQGHLGDTQLVSALAGKDKTTHLWASVVSLTQWAFDQKASDIDYIVYEHMESSQVAFKINGIYVRPERWRMPTQTMVQMLQVAWQHSKGGVDANFQIHSTQQSTLLISLQGSHTVRLRWSGLSTDKGCVVTQRIQPIGQSTAFRSLEGAGCLPWHIDTFKRVLKSQGGLTTLAGRLGSGKSVTLAILMTMQPDHFKMVEVSSPVEIDLGTHVHQTTILQNLTATAQHDPEFAATIRAIFRSVADKALIGEIRDPETALLARGILESGHSVFASTHAPDALASLPSTPLPRLGFPGTFWPLPATFVSMSFRHFCPSCAAAHSRLKSTWMVWVLPSMANYSGTLTASSGFTSCPAIATGCATRTAAPCAATAKPTCFTGYRVAPW